MEPAGQGTEVQTRLDKLRRVATRRTTWGLLILPLLIPLLFIGFWLFDRRRTEDRHSGRAFLVAFVIVVIVTAAVVVIAAAASRRRPDSRWAPVLAAGMARAERREVARAVRRGHPSSDPFTREVERDSARRLTLQNRHMNKIGLAFVALYVLRAIFADSWRVRVAGLGVGLFWVLLIVMATKMRQRGERYLRALDDQYGGQSTAPDLHREASRAPRRRARPSRRTVVARLVPIALWLGAWTTMALVDSIVEDVDTSNDSPVALDVFAGLMVVGTVTVIVLFAVGSSRARLASLIVAPLCIVGCVLDALVVRPADVESDWAGAMAFAVVLLYSARLRDPDPRSAASQQLRDTPGAAWET